MKELRTYIKVNFSTYSSINTVISSPQFESRSQHPHSSVIYLRFALQQFCCISHPSSTNQTKPHTPHNAKRTNKQEVLGSFGCEEVTSAAEQLREIANLYVVPPENLTSLMEQGLLAEMGTEVPASIRVVFF